MASISASTFATAQSINGFFTTTFNANIQDSTTIGHVEITQSGRATAGYDWYSFSHTGGTVHLDMDSPSNTDMEIGIFDTATGALIAQNDDNGGDAGDASGLNSAIFNLNLAAGNYTVGVCRFSCDFFAPAGVSGSQLAAGASYVFNISANGSDIPEPSSVALAGLALLGLAGTRLQKRK